MHQQRSRSSGSGAFFFPQTAGPWPPPAPNRFPAVFAVGRSQTLEQCPRPACRARPPDSAGKHVLAFPPGFLPSAPVAWASVPVTRSRPGKTDTETPGNVAFRRSQPRRSELTVLRAVGGMGGRLGPPADAVSAATSQGPECVPCAQRETSAGLPGGFPRRGRRTIFKRLVSDQSLELARSSLGAPGRDTGVAAGRAGSTGLRLARAGHSPATGLQGIPKGCSPLLPGPPRVSPSRFGAGTMGGWCVPPYPRQRV